MSILICDNSLALLDLLDLHLSNDGFQVKTISMLSKLEPTFQVMVPDIAIIDYNFDIGNSERIIKLLKNKYKNTAFILMSSVSNIKSISNELGIIHFISKPFSLTLLSKKLKKILNEKKEENNCN